MSKTKIDRSPTLKLEENTLSIRPYIDHNVKDSMGHEKYNISVFEGVVHVENLAMVEQNGIVRALTGLNEFAPEIKLLPEPDRTAAIKDIRQTVAQLEKELGANVIDPEDPDFWNKVKILRPDNIEFWGQITLHVGNEPVFLDPAKNPYDLIKVRAIQSGGFTIVAKSLEAARKSQRPPQFYLDRLEETVSTKTEVRKLRDQAGSDLQMLYRKNPNKLMLVCKVVDANSAQYRNRTSLDVMYDNMGAYIDGETVDTNKKKTAQHFIDICSLDMDVLTVRAIVKDASFYKLIGLRGDGMIYHMASGTAMGRNPSEVAEFLRNPINDEIYKRLLSECEEYWNK